MDNENKLQSRKKFIGVGISAAALFTAFRFFIPGKKEKIRHGKNAYAGWQTCGS